MLKLLACLIMLIDHAGYYFNDMLPYPLYIALRAAGRLAFPMFAFMVARGCLKTRNPLFYFLRMSGFAVAAELLFQFLNRQPGLPPYPTNVLITFSLAIVLVFGYQLATRSGLDMIASLRPIAPTSSTVPTPSRFDIRINLGGIRLDSRAGLILGILMAVTAIIATVWLKSSDIFSPDYDFYGLLTVLIFFIVQDRCDDKNIYLYSLLGFSLLNLAFIFIQSLGSQISSSLFQSLSIAAVPIIFALNDDKRPKKTVKYAFYLFYPLHILTLALIRLLILNGW